MKKIIFFAFRGDPLCFIHVLINSIDMHEKGMEGRIVLEGESVKLVREMSQPGHFLHQLYTTAKEKELILGACRACANKLEVTDDIVQEKIALIGNLSGHPAMSDYITKGFTILTF